MSVTPTEKTEEPQALRQVTVPCPQEGCQCLSVSDHPPQPQYWLSVAALAHVTSRCSKALDSRILFHPFSQFGKMSP